MEYLNIAYVIIEASDWNLCTTFYSSKENKVSYTFCAPFLAFKEKAYEELKKNLVKNLNINTTIKDTLLIVNISKCNITNNGTYVNINNQFYMDITLNLYDFMKGKYNKDIFIKQKG